MSSTSRAFSQRPTNAFVTNSSGYLLNPDITSWEGLGNPKKIGNVYIYNSFDLFNAAMQTVWLNGSNFVLDPINTNTTIKDLGKDLYFGIQNEANLVHLRLVEVPGTVEDSGEKGIVGYVYLEVNYANPGTYVPEVGVSRI